jgi:general secretion pathway protein D
MRKNIVRRRRLPRSLALLLGLIQVLGCTHAPPAAIPALSPLPNGGTAAPPRINGAVGTPDALSPAKFAYGRQDQPAPEPSATEAGPGNVSLRFADTDIREVAAQILGSIPKVNYTIDPAVHGTATLHTVRPLNRSELVPTLESLLAQNGAALVTNGGLYRIVPAAQAIATAASSAGTAGAVVVPLQYPTAENLAKILQPYVGEGGKIAVSPANPARGKD